MVFAPRRFNKRIIYSIFILFFILSQVKSFAAFSQVKSVPSIIDFGNNRVRTAINNPELESALRCINEKKYSEALEKINTALEKNPADATAHELHGTVVTLEGDIKKGLLSLKKAIELNPNQSSAFTKIGDIYIATHDLQMAKQFFNDAIRLDPYDRRAHQRLGIIYEHEKNATLAIAHFEKGIWGTPPGYLGIKVNLGKLYNQEGQYKRTIELLSFPGMEKHRNTTAHIVLGTAYLASKETDEAIAQFETAKSLEPKTERAYLSLGIAYREKGLFIQSLEALKIVEKLKPKWGTGYFQAGQTFFEMKKYDSALKKFKKAEGLSSSPGFIKKRIADIYIAQKKYDKAIIVYKSMLKSGDPDPKTYDLLGSAYQMLDQLDLAEKTFETMSKKYPADVFAQYRMGLFCGYIKKYTQAITHLKKANELAPNNIFILKALAVSYGQNGNTQERIEKAEQILNIQPDDTGNLFFLASVYQDASMDSDAIKIYREIIARQNNHPAALNNLADILSEKGDLKEAVTLAEQAVAAAPENGMILDTLGWILVKKKNYDRAISILEKSSSLLPNRPVTYYHLGVAYQATGQNNSAKKMLNKALTLSSTFKNADGVGSGQTNIP